MFVGATRLLAETYRPSEASKVQACNEFLTFTAVGIASLSVGWIEGNFGWITTNIVALAPVVFVALTTVWLRLNFTHWQEESTAATFENASSGRGADTH